MLTVEQAVKYFTEAIFQWFKYPLSKQEDQDFIPTLPKCFFSPQVQGGGRKKENLLIDGIIKYHYPQTEVKKPYLCCSLGR